VRLLIARHCETDWNARHKVQGSADIPLNDNGRRQAAALAGKLAAENVSRIVCSDLSRAVETARIIGARLGVAVETDARLRECSFGLVEGMSFRWFKMLFGGMRGRPYRKRLSYDFRLFGGESGQRVALRHMQAILALVRAGPHDATVLVIGHGRGLRTFFTAMGLEHYDDPPQGDYLVLPP
jgi:broad specificity phosphatase PhoE